jgi:hypothetical protein
MMQACADLEDIARSPIVGGVREASQKDAPKVTVRHWPHLGHRDQEIKDAPQFNLKFCSESSALRFVPLTRVRNVLGGTRCKPECGSAQTPRRRALSSSMLIVACSVGSARRASSSLRCHCGTGTSATDAVRLSQISPTSRKRSAAGRSRISVSRAGRLMDGMWRNAHPASRGAPSRTDPQICGAFRASTDRVRHNAQVELRASQ